MLHPHPELLHLSAPVHLRAHPLQLAGSLSTAFSQPSSVAPGIGPLQFAKPIAQDESQSPLAQCTVSTLEVLHASLQPPQLSELPAVLISQPFPTFMSQSAHGMLHDAIEHCP